MAISAHVSVNFELVFFAPSFGGFSTCSIAVILVSTSAHISVGFEIVFPAPHLGGVLAGGKLYKIID